MGEIVMAIKCTHVPSMLISEQPGPAHGCRQGICASCTCVLLSGCVRDLRSGALCSEPGQPIRLCVSAAHGDLALDL